MDDIGRALSNLLDNLPAGEDEAKDALPAQSEDGGDLGDLSALFGGEGGSGGGLLAGLTGGGLSGVLSLLGGHCDSEKLALLRALKPHMRDGRSDRIDKLCRMMDAAYGIRGAMRSFGGMLNV
jgi:hypothetical protein